MSQRPRILILSTTYLPLIGGSELAIRNITDRMTGYDFDMVTGRHTADMPLVEQIGRIRVFRAGGRMARLTLLLPKNLMPLAIAVTAWRLARAHAYTAVHAYQASQAAGAAWLLKLLMPGLPLIVTLQEGKELDRQPLLLRFFRGLIFRSSNRITAISKHLAAYARRYTKTPIDIIPNGVDLETFHPSRTQSQEPKKEKIIISVSRLVPKNGIANLIRALPVVLATIPARLVLVGGGPLRASLEQLATDLQVRGTIDFVGSIPHDRLMEYMGSADVFVRPSLSEGLGSAFLEAMAAGVPIVASHVGGIADFLHDGETGLVCNPTQPHDIAAQIIRVLTDDALHQHIGDRGLALVREHYNWDVIARQMAQVYAGVAQTS